MERRVDDLELICLSEIHDERDDRVSALEATAASFEEWRPWIEAAVDDAPFDVRRVTKL